jgi:exopolyphosphatase/guanosine-5'-triphosphate,3'-diphosphate pyrophosphatase
MRRRALLNLGFSVGARGSIPADRLAASIAAANRLRRALDELQPDVVVALATAALRDASNGAEVVARLERVVGSPVRVLDGEEEARLCFSGQRAGVWIGDGPVLGLDLGGGSFEVAVGNARDITLAMSARWGPPGCKVNWAPATPCRSRTDQPSGAGRRRPWSRYVRPWPPTRRSRLGRW